MIRTNFNHATQTWLLAHLLNFIILLVFYCLSGGFYMLDILGLIIIITLVASLPVVFVYWWILHLIINSSYSSGTKLFIWILIAPLLTAINAFLLAYGLSGDFYVSELIPFGIPAVAATLIAVLIRYHQFRSLNEYIMEKKTNEGAPNLLS